MAKRPFSYVSPSSSEDDSESDSDEEAESDFSEEEGLEPGKDTKSKAGPKRPKLELDLCPVCNEKPTYPVETSCFHMFCATCFVRHWRSSYHRWRFPVSCRKCKRPVRSLLPRFGEPRDPEDLQLKNGMLWNINDYNCQFSTGPRLWMEYGSTESRPEPPVPTVHCCPVCRIESRYPVVSNCGHVVCVRCLVQYWRCVKMRVPVDCLLCRDPVTLLRPGFGQPDPKTDDLHLRNGVLWNVNDYNIQCSAGPKRRLEYSTEPRTGLSQTECPLCKGPTDHSDIPTVCNGCLMQHWSQSPGYAPPTVFLPRFRTQSRRLDDRTTPDGIYEYRVSSPADRTLRLEYRVMAL